MARTRISTTVDDRLLAAARQLEAGRNDAALLDAALAALLAVNREAEIDTSYRAYDVVPLDRPDAWGDLDAFRRAASAS